MDNTQLSDDQEFDHAVAHAHMMWRECYKRECARRNADMEWNEAQANEAMAATAKQNQLDEQWNQARLVNKAEQERKQDANDKFWGHVFFVVTGALVLIVLAFLYQIMKG